jgi:putative cardiolipin synthase
MGTLNLDPRSVVENTEIGVVFTAPAVAAQTSDWFDENIGTRAFRLELVENKTGDLPADETRRMNYSAL